MSGGGGGDWLSSAGDWIGNLFSSSNTPTGGLEWAPGFTEAGGQMAPGTAELKGLTGWTTDPSQYTLAPGSTNLGDTSWGDIKSVAGKISSGVSALNKASEAQKSAAEKLQATQQTATQMAQSAMSRGSPGDILSAILTLRNNRLNQLWANAQGGRANESQPYGRTRGLLGM
jgi:hypothetical protein